VILASDNSWFY